MILSETHILPFDKQLDELTLKCKNLYNKSNYIIRQEFIENGRYINKFEICSDVKT